MVLHASMAAAEHGSDPAVPSPQRPAPGPCRTDRALLGRGEQGLALASPRYECEWPTTASSVRGKRDDAVVQVGGGVQKGLPDVFLFQFRILPTQLLAIGVGRQQFNYPAHGE